MKKSLSILMTVAVLLGGCKSIWNVTDPFALGNNNPNTGNLRIVIDNMIALKVNGIPLPTKNNNAEVILLAGKNELEIAINALPGGGRGFISMFKSFMIVGKVEIEIESGKTYLLLAAEAATTSILSIPFGSFVPVGDHRFLFEEYTGKLKSTRIAEFPAVKFDGKDWESYQYPLIQSQE